MSKTGTYVMRNGKLVRARPADLRENDNHDMLSWGAAVHPYQVPEFNRMYADEGTTFRPQDGKAVFANRQARKRHLKRRGFIDRDEICG